jgi:hypothetical protein
MNTQSRSIATLAMVTFLTVAAHAQLTVMQPVTAFGTHGDGSVRPGDVTGLTADSQLQRGMAYNPTTGHLLYVDRSTNAGINYTVYILDGTTGAQIGSLQNISPLDGGNISFPLNLVGVADDGAIYAANLANSTVGTPQMRIYRWASELDGPAIVSPALPPTAADDPSSGSTNVTEKRFGDTMVVRGAGLNTQILLANRGTLAALYTPDDVSMAHFTPKTLTTTVQTGGIGTGLSFGAGNTFWGTSGANGNGPLYHLSYNFGAGTATVLTNFAAPGFPGRLSQILVMTNLNLLAGITMVSGADVVRLYGLSNSNAPVLMDRQTWVTNRDNATFSGALALGTNNVLYVLDSDSGIMAFNLAPSASNPLAPSIYQNPSGDTAVVGGSVTLVAGADSTSPIDYRWYFFGTNLVSGATSNVLVLTNLQVTNTGGYSVVASNVVGMATSAVATVTVLAAPPSTLLLYEPFNYTADQLLTAANPAWTLNGSGNDTRIEAGNLSYTGLPASIGNSATNGGAGAGMRYALSSTIIDGEIYYSFLFKMNSVGTAFNVQNSFIAALVDPAGSSTYQARLMPRTNTIPGQYNLGITKISTTIGQVWATNDFVEGQTLFIVARYKFNNLTTTDDQADLWINPDPSSFGATSAPPATVSAVQTGTDQSLISQFTLRQNTAGNTPAAMSYDELRIGLKWADVAPAPAPFVPSLTITNNGNGTVTLLWPTAATGYGLVGNADVTTPRSSWTAVSGSVVPAGTNNTVTVSIGTGAKFFGLKK